MRDHIVRLIEHGQSLAVRNFVLATPRSAEVVHPPKATVQPGTTPSWFGAIVPSIVEDRTLDPVASRVGLRNDELLAARLSLASPDAALALTYDMQQARMVDLGDGRWSLVLSGTPDTPIVVSFFVRREHRSQLAAVLTKLGKQVARRTWRYYRTIAARLWPDSFRAPMPPPAASRPNAIPADSSPTFW